ncbi:SOCS box domain-containing protein [Nephila pilipes]|uniref:SOCS box domain-containing protein n=1 Tax=Nephila pilipes TaxID=299642 RepID=A0A8X6T221_NEPPI|nr:SOCS box domain-containing protein [Nephila pilipes]
MGPYPLCCCSDISLISSFKPQICQVHMEILFQSVGPGVHCYSPFPKSPPRCSSINLEELCKSVILKCITLRRLATGVMKLPLPKRLLRYITELTTADFEQIECAPFCDVFSFNFFHKALTYRVICLRDQQEYMITYGCSPLEDEKLKVGHEKWVKVQHKNVMCICATVKDPSTDNIFYVYDQPYASLEQLWSVFCEKNHPVPEIFFARLTTDLCEALKHISFNGLHYSHFGLDNIFIAHDRLVLENALMRKSSKFLIDSIKKDSTNEESMLRDVVKVLYLLLKNDTKFSPSNAIRTLINGIENQACFDGVLQIVNSSTEAHHNKCSSKLSV